MPVPDLEKLNASARPAWLWDPRLRRVIWANPAAAAFFGEGSLLDLVERPFDAREPGVEAIARALNEGGAESVELLFPSASEEPLAASVRPHALPDGRTGAFVMALHALPGQEGAPPGLLREVLASMPLAVAVHDVEARLVYANPAAIEMFGEEALDALSGLFDSIAEARAFLARAARAGMAAVTRPATIRGTRRDVRITARLMEDDGLLTLVMEDVTPRRLLAERMKTLPFPSSAGEGAAAAEEAGEAAAPPPARLPLSAEDLRTFRRLSGQEGDAAAQDAEKAPSSGQEAPREPARDAAPEKREESPPAPDEEGPKAAKTAKGPVVIIGAARQRKGKKPPKAPIAPAEEAAAASEAEATGDREAPRPPAQEAGDTPLAADERPPCEDAEAAVSRPETPQLVREVLDQRKEPIILQRAERFYYANEAARALFAAPLEAKVWDGIAARLAAVADGAVVRLPDDDGAPFRLKRDVFPWRDGAVVQSTLAPLGEGHGEGNEPRKRPGEEATPAEKPAEEAATKPEEAGPAKEPELPAARAKRAGPVSISTLPPKGTDAEGAGAEDAEEAGTPREESAAQAAPPAAASPEPELQTPSPAAQPCQPEPIDAELRAILDTATDGIITLNRDGEILSFSAGAEALFGLSLKEAVGRPFRELLEPESRRILRDYLEVLETGGELAAIYDEGREVMARVAGGGTIPLFLTIGRLGRRGEPERPNKAAYCIVVRDITQWKKTESELRAAKERAERSSAQKSEFLAAISHELRTPLNAILGFSDVMRQQRFGEMGNEKYLVYANDIHESGEHLLSLINDLLDLSKIEAGKMEMHFEAVDIAAIARESLNLMEEQAARAQVLLRRSIPSGLPKVVADARAMKQIFLNLLSNAVKFTPAGGQVMLALKLSGAGELVATVSDTGPGMSAEELAQAMKPFRRLSGKGREDKPGTGLGLPLTRALAEASKARFELKSAPGKGTTARIIFPTPRVLAG